MYLFDFIKSLFKVSKIPVVIYLVLNTFIVAILLGSFFTTEFGIALLYGLGIYLLSLIIALSPVGEWILRIQTGCYKIERVDQLEFIQPIFNRVLANARVINSSIPKDVKLYMNNNQDYNAFATGRKTVCISEGLLSLTTKQIEATLAHEMGHLAGKDTDLILIVAVGNFIVTAFFIVIRIMAKFTTILFWVFGLLAGEGIMSIGVAISGFITDFFLVALMWIWTKIGILLVMTSSRSNEYLADEFSYKMGYGVELCEVLDKIEETGSKGLFVNLMNSHPNKNSRIAKLIELGNQSLY